VRALIEREGLPWYRYATDGKEGEVDEKTLIGWRDSELWNLWIRNSDSGIEIHRNGKPLDLTAPQLKRALFTLGSNRGSAKRVTTLYQIIDGEKRPERVNVLMSRLTAALKRVSPDLAERITNPDKKQYGFDLAGLRYCVSEQIRASNRRAKENSYESNT